ncbi:hypothetical protein [Candidatus Poriferisocius sp.]|uniref:hypothetical protein n=1 Tax=Candidatus Poriferisocius sp. TaxID=3101276 RepID=UPI003B02A9B8
MKKLSILCAVFGLLAAACGGGDSGNGDGPTGQGPSPTPVAAPPTIEGDSAPDDSASHGAVDDSQPETEDAAGDQATAAPDSTAPSDGDIPETEEVAATHPIFQPPCAGEGELGATATGVTEDTIKVGAPQVDFEELGNLGIAQIERGDYEVILQALADEVNDNGGICGRMVEPIIYKFLPFGTDTSLAGCVYFTEDEQVFAVLGEFTRVPAGNLCVTESHSTALLGAPYTADDLARANAPWVALEIADDRLMSVFVSALDQAGLLADVGRVAVHSDIERKDRVDNVLVPALEAAGVDIVARTVSDAPPGDIQAGASIWRTFLEIYRNADVDTVFLEGDTNVSVEQIIQGGLEVDVFSVDHGPFGFGLRDSSDPSYFDAYSIGSPYSGDETNRRTDDCIDIFERRTGIQVISPSLVPDDGINWHTPVLGGCRIMDLFAQLAAAAGPNLTNETLQAAIDGFGSIELPNEAFASLGVDKYDARDGVVLMKWDHEADEGEGNFVVISELIDTSG